MKLIPNSVTRSVATAVLRSHGTHRIFYLVSVWLASLVGLYWPAERRSRIELEA